MAGAPRILCVGAGLAGLSFASVWARAGGHPVTVVERGASSAVGAAGIGLHLNAQRALETCGVLDVVRARSIDMDEYTDAWGSPTWAVHRADLNAALVAAVPGDWLRSGLGVSDLTVEGPHVDVGFDDGNREVFDLVIGADGVHSTVRRVAYGDGFTRYGGACFWRTTLARCIVERPYSARVGDAGIALRPLVGDRTHVFIQRFSSEPIDDLIEGRVARLRSQLAGRDHNVDQMLALLGADRDVHFGALEWVEPAHWGAWPVVLIGDAAHSMAPSLALGGAMALEDGVVLAEELRADDLPRSIERFVNRRSPRVAFVQHRTAIALDRRAGKAVPDEPDEPLERLRLDFRPLLDPA